MSIALEVIAIAVVYVMINVTIQRKFGNIKRMKEIRAQLNAKMDELKKMPKDSSMESLKAKQSEITALTSESLKHQMKPTLLVLPISLILFYVGLPLIFGSQKLSISILGIALTSYQSFFVAVAIVLGLLSTAILSIYDKITTAKKAKEIEAQDTAEDQRGN